MTTTRNHKLIISIIATILAVSLLCTVCFIAQEKVQTADKAYAENYSSNLVTNDGKILDHPSGNEHYTEAELRAKAEAQGKMFKWITTQDDLHYFIANNNNNLMNNGNVYAALSKNLELDWVGATKTYFGNDNSSMYTLGSNAIFDGNGYTISIKAGLGKGRYSSDVWTCDNNIMPVPNTDESGNANNKRDNINMIFTGYFFAKVEGTIKNTSFSFTSTHQVSTTKDLDTSKSLYNDTQYLVVAGIVAGAVIGGTVDNCRLDVNNNFVHGRNGIGYSGFDWKFFKENGVFTAGIAGLVTKGARINAVTVNIKNGATICSHATGASSGTTRGGIAITGGVVGNYAPVGGTQITRVTLMGEGSVEAYMGYANQDSHFQTFPGGVLGASMYFTDWGNWKNYIIGESSYSTHYSGQGLSDSGAKISSIMSGWQGYIMHNLRVAWDRRLEKKEYAAMFGCVGGTTQNASGISGLVALYDYINVRKAKGVPEANCDALDVEHCDGVYNGNGRIPYSTVGIQIYPATTGGSVTVSFDTRVSSYDIRVEAKADEYDLTEFGEMNQDIGSAAYKTGTYKDNQFGYTIWSLDINTGNANTQQIKPTDCAGADIRFLTAEEYGSYVYKFGEVVDYQLKSNNAGSNKPYDGVALNDPTLKLFGKAGNIPLAENDGTVLNKLPYQIELKTAITNQLISDHSRAKLPGSYVYESVYTYGDESTGTKLAYYDQTNRKIARYDSSKKNVYAINVATLTVTGAQPTWVKEANLTLTIGSGGGTFQAIKYSKNGVWNPNLIPTAGNTYHEFRVNETTSSYGDEYIFEAYCHETSPTGEPIDVKVAELTSSVNVLVDASAPIIRNIKYFREVTGTDGATSWTAITEEQATTEWRKTPIKMTYEFSDEGRSGLASLSAGNTYVEKTNPTTGEKYWECETVMTTGAQYTIICTDARGNEFTKYVRVSIDSTNPTLTAAIGSTNYDSFYMYNETWCYSEALPIDYTATVGGSEYVIQMSISKDSAGNDIWQDTTADVNGSHWSIKDDVSQSVIKFRLWNKTKLYGDENGYLPAVEVSLNQGVEFFVRLAIADVYLTLADIIYTGDMQNSAGESMQNKTLAQIKEEGMLGALLAKQYDNKAQNVFSDIRVKLFDNSGNYEGNGGAIELHDDTKTKSDYPKSSFFEMVVNYENVNAGATNVVFSIKGKTDAERHDKLFPVHFADSITHDTNGLHDASAANAAIQNLREGEAVANVTISPYTMTIEVSNHINASYTYGDAIATSFEEKLTYDDKFVTFDTTGGLKTKCDAGTYNVGAKARELNPNYIFNVVDRAGVEVGKKEVYAVSYLDNNVNWVHTITFDGKEHTLTADMLDVDGNRLPLTVEYYSDVARTNTNIITGPDNKPITSIIKTGTYFVKFVAGAEISKNYVVLNEVEFEIEIKKAHIPMELGTIEKEYTGTQIAYTPKVNVADDYYSVNDFKFTYYQYSDDAVYDPVTKKMIKGTPKGEPIHFADVKNVGYYAVTVEFNGEDTNQYFYENTYSNNLLVINKAPVEIKAGNVSVTYDGNGYIFNHTAANTKLMSRANGDETEITDAGIVDSISINKFDFATSSYVAVTDADKMTDAGKYTYRLIFEETDCYKGATLDVDLVINKANFAGIAFEDKSIDYNPKNSVVFSATYDKNNLPSGTTVSYKYAGGAQENPYEFKDADKYVVEFTLSRANYNNLTLKATLTINAIDLVGIQADVTQNTLTYDGKEHTAKIVGVGLKQAADGTYTYNDLKATVTTIGGKGIDAGTYEGSYSIRVKNYKVLTINTPLLIEQVELTTDKVDYSQILNMTKYTTEVDFRNVQGSYTDVFGKKIEKGFRYYRLNDGGVYEEVGLTEEGTLVEGKYRAYISCGKNYKAVAYIDINIVDPNATGSTNNPTVEKNSINMYVIIGSVCGGIIVVGIVLGVIIALKKKKNSNKNSVV